MFFTKQYMDSAVAKQQAKLIKFNRKTGYQADAQHNQMMANALAAEGIMAKSLAVNEGFIPQDVYKDFDKDIKTEQLADRGMPFINRLIPRAKSVGIGRLTSSYAQSSEVGVVRSSLAGQQGILADAIEHKYDGFPVVVHDTATEVNWRQFASASAEGYDLLRENVSSSVRAMNEHFADTLLDGLVDKDGNYITVDGKSWKGMRNDTHIEQVNLGAAGINFDFTDGTQTGEAIKAAFLEVRNALRVDNNYGGQVFFTISVEIETVWEKRFSAQYDSKTVMQELSGMAGVAGFEMSRKLTGNQIMGLPESDDVRPLVAMPVSTIILPRRMYNDNYRAVTSAVVGWQAKNDFEGRKTALYASVIS
jgi:hypothetical protein